MDVLDYSKLKRFNNNKNNNKSKLLYNTVYNNTADE